MLRYLRRKELSTPKPPNSKPLRHVCEPPKSVSRRQPAPESVHQANRPLADPVLDSVLHLGIPLLTAQRKKTVPQAPLLRSSNRLHDQTHQNDHNQEMLADQRQDGSKKRIPRILRLKCQGDYLPPRALAKAKMETFLRRRHRSKAMTPGGSSAGYVMVASV